MFATMRTLVLSMMVLGLFGGGAVQRQASAQEDAFFPVFVLACDAYVRMQGSAAGFGYPPECRGIDGVSVTAYDTLGVRLDDCTTDAEGTCRLAIDYNGVRIFQQTTDTVPEGYRAEANVQRVFTYTEFAEIAFHNYREDVLPQRDSATATVRVHSRICPDSYTGDTFFDDCNAGIPQTDQWVFGNGDFARAGKDGNAILRDMPAGNSSEIIGGQSYLTGDVFFYCSQTKDASVRVRTSLEVTALYDGITRDFVGKVDLEPGDDVTCDWYQIPFLDRGLWDTVVNPLLEGDDKTLTIGNIQINMFRCDAGYLPKPGVDVSGSCATPENGATVRAKNDGGTEIASATSNAEGRLDLDVSESPLAPIWITLDGHASSEQDLMICVAVLINPGGPGGSTDPRVQATVVDGAAWTIPGYGEDVNGLVCLWYLVPTES